MQHEPVHGQFTQHIVGGFFAEVIGRFGICTGTQGRELYSFLTLTLTLTLALALALAFAPA